jgi:hypothetical protein
LALEFANHLPTRFWLPAALTAIGQGILLSDQVEWLGALQPAHLPGWLMGQSLLVVGLCNAVWIARRCRAEEPSMQRMWHDFRDQFGLLWALRIAEQLNTTARVAGWPVELRWRGFFHSDGTRLRGDTLAELGPGFQQAWHNLLRRFVSAEWIERRI